MKVRSGSFDSIICFSSPEVAYIDHNILANVARTSQSLSGMTKRNFKPRYFRPTSTIFIGTKRLNFYGQSFIEFCTGRFYKNL